MCKPENKFQVSKSQVHISNKCSDKLTINLNSDKSPAFIKLNFSHLMSSPKLHEIVTDPQKPRIKWSSWSSSFLNSIFIVYQYIIQHFWEQPTKVVKIAALHWGQVVEAAAVSCPTTERIMAEWCLNLKISQNIQKNVLTVRPLHLIIFLPRYFDRGILEKLSALPLVLSM